MIWPQVVWGAVENVALANGLTDPDKILVGQLLCSLA